MDFAISHELNIYWKFNLINWQFKEIERIVRSSLAVETLTMLIGIGSRLYKAALLNELLMVNYYKQYQ